MLTKRKAPPPPPRPSQDVKSDDSGSNNSADSSHRLGDSLAEGGAVQQQSSDFVKALHALRSNARIDIADASVAEAAPVAGGELQALSERVDNLALALRGLEVEARANRQTDLVRR